MDLGLRKFLSRCPEKEITPDRAAVGIDYTEACVALHRTGVDGMYRAVYALEIDTKYTALAPTVGSKYALSADRSSAQ